MPDCEYRRLWTEQLIHLGDRKTGVVCARVGLLQPELVPVIMSDHVDDIGNVGSNDLRPPSVNPRSSAG